MFSQANSDVTEGVITTRSNRMKFRLAWRTSTMTFYSARLTDLAYSGQFKGKTWLPYTRIVQYMDLIDKW